MSVAQNNKTQPSQTGSDSAVRTVTAKPNGARRPDANCNPGSLTVYINLPASGGTWNATYTFSFPSGGLGCGSPGLVNANNVSWITINNILQTCSPNPEPPDTIITCTAPYTVAQNTGAERSAPLCVYFGSSGTLCATTSQLGPTESLSVNVSGSGTVKSSPAGISCPSVCQAGFSYGTAVSLSATAGTGYKFTGWSGACSGTGACPITMYSPTSVTATFTAIPETLTVTVSGSGTVMSSPSGISCPGLCATSFSYGSVVYLTETPSTGYVFAGWSGACSGTANVCTVTMSAPKTVTAKFTQLETLTVSVGGSGTVTSSPSGISCPGTCSATFNQGTIVNLAASPSSGNGLLAWSGACSGTGACTVTMNSSQAVTATFAPLETLTVSVSGSGTVASSPSGISCPGTCLANFTQGTIVSLTASPSSGNGLLAWSGACSGTGACTVTMNSSQAVTAAFAPLETLTVSVSGSGTVTSSPSGISCPGTCAATFAEGTVVNLQESPTSGYTFAGWGSACYGNGACAVTMRYAQSVDAGFDQVTPGTVSTVAGNGTYGYSGDGGAATSAELAEPSGVAVDSAGNFYIADYSNQRIRKVTVPSGVISTAAGSGTAGYSGDGVAATSAELNQPSSVAVDSAGNIYIADTYNQRIRKVTASTGKISTVAGNGTAGYSGDGEAATSAELYYPYGVAVDAAGNIYIADFVNQRIRKVTASTGIISTVAGDGSAGYSGDGGAATSAELNFPYGVAVDSSGNIYISDESNYRIRKVTASTGIITTVAGDGVQGYFGDGGPATSAELGSIGIVALDTTGNIYLMDQNCIVRKVTISTGIISTIVGNGICGYSGDGGPATSAEFNGILGIAFDASGNMYVGDAGNERIRKITP